MRDMGGQIPDDERAFLFLQGPLSSFYSEIAGCLMRAGRRVVRVNVCGNDVMDWRHHGALDYRGTCDGWPAFLEERVAPLGIACVVLHGDRRPYHRAAIAWAKRRGIEVVVTELGYLRPDWMTIERGGCSAGSHFPVDPRIIRAIAARVPPVEEAVVYPHSTLRLIVQELRFTLFNALYRWRFPHYRSHRPRGPLTVYSGWLAGQLRASRLRRAGGAGLRALLASGQRFHVFALQLADDYQIRDHSPFADVAAAVEHVVGSFAAHAPSDTVLVLKPHPQEYARRRLMRAIAAAGDRHAVGHRLRVVEGVPVGVLCEMAAGFVTVNSSAGFEALAAGCPTFAIMPTLYDCEGLTFQGPLDRFWSAGSAPDAALNTSLRRALAGTVQVRGTLYHREGVKAAACAAAARLVEGRVNEPGAYSDPPPRLAKAARMGVRYE